MAKRILAIVLAFIYSIMYAIVGPMMKSQDMIFKTDYIVAFFVCFILSLIFNMLILSVIPSKKSVIINSRAFRPLTKAENKVSKCLNKLGNNKLLVIVWSFIFISYLPVYLLVYPGIMSYDAISQTTSAMTKITNNHHPVLHTWLIRVFMRLGENVFNSYEHGIGIYSLLQMIILSYALARLVVLLKKKNVPGILVIFTALISALWFENACLCVTMTKDIFHAAFLVLFVCHYVEIVTAPNEYVSKIRNLISLPIVSFFMFAFRNNGIHIYVFCFALLMLIRIKKIRSFKKYIALILVILLPAVAFKIYQGPVFKAMGIEQGQVREALSVPIQQLQRVAVLRASELTEEQTRLMDYYIDNLGWREWDSGRQYDPFIADPAKSCFYSDNYKADVAQFWKFYLKTGKQFTKEYVEAFLSNTLGYWYPGYYRYSYVMYDNYPPENFIVPLERKSVIHANGLSHILKSMCSDDAWREMYVVRLFFVPAFLVWMLIISMIISCKSKEFITKELPLFLPLIAQFGIMILSPMSSFRYSWPLNLMLPVVLIAIFSKRLTTQNINKDEKVVNDNEA